MNNCFDSNFEKGSDVYSRPIVCSEHVNAAKVKLTVSNSYKTKM